MSEAGNHRGPEPHLAYGITIPLLVGCVALAALSSHDGLVDPLTIALALCAICASVAYVPLEGKLLVDATFVPLMLAIAFLGPAPAFVIVSASELGAWLIQRYRASVVPINLVAVGSVALAGAAIFNALALSPGAWFYIALATTGALTLVVNDLLVTTLVGVLDGSPIRSRLTGHVKLIPALAINVALAVAAANIYANTGLEAVIFVCGLIVAFNYMVRQTLSARERAWQVEKLAASRERLVTETLGAEARERRALAESLHDGAIQSLLSAGQDLEEAARGQDGALANARSALDDTVKQLRSAVFDLHPTVSDRAGLARALQHIVDTASDRAGFAATVRVDPNADGADRLISSVARELVTNVAKHAAADNVMVAVTCEGDDWVVLEVVDDGVGFDQALSDDAVSAGHIGLQSCRERCEAREGRLLVETAPGRGTVVRAIVPAVPTSAGPKRRATEETAT